MLRPFIDPLVTPDTTFVDLFVGGGSVLLDIAARFPDIPLVANDADAGIAALWSVLGGAEDDVLGLESMLDVEPTRDLWESLRADVSEDPVEAAFSVIYLSRTSYGGSLAARAMKDIGSRYSPAGIRKQIRCAWELLHGRLTVTSMDAVAWLGEHRGDESNVLFADPPYFVEGKDLYRVAMSPREHAALRDRLRDKSNWVLTYRDNPIVRHLYGCWCDIQCSPKGKDEVVIVPAGAAGRMSTEASPDSHDLTGERSVSEYSMAQDEQQCIAVGPNDTPGYDRSISPATDATAGQGGKHSGRKKKDLSFRRAWSIEELEELYPYSESTLRNFIDDGLLRCHRPNGVRGACVFIKDLEEFEDRVRGA